MAPGLSIKARLYGAVGYAVYWVVTREGVHVHTSPDSDGYRTVTRCGPQEWVPLPYADSTVAVSELLVASTD